MASDEVIKKLRDYSEAEVGADLVNIADILFGNSKYNQLEHNESVYRYDKKLQAEIEYLRNEIGKYEGGGGGEIPDYINKLSCLPRILSTHHLQSTISSLKNNLISLKDREVSLKDQLEREEKLYSASVFLGDELESEVQALVAETEESTKGIIRSVALNEEQIDENIENLKLHLKSVLENDVANILYEQIEDKANNDYTFNSLKTALVVRFQDLLNEMFEPQESSGGYLTISDPDDVIARFLLRGNLITSKDNLTKIRLREFGTRLPE